MTEMLSLIVLAPATLEAVYRSAQFPLFAGMMAVLFGCLASLNFIWKMKDEVYAKDVYINSVSGMLDIEPGLRPLKGFDQLRWLALTTAGSALVAGVYQVSFGFFYHSWSAVLGFVLAGLVVGMVVKLLYLLTVTSKFATRLAEKEAAEKMAKNRAASAAPNSSPTS